MAREEVRQASPSSPRPTSRCCKAGYNYCDITEALPGPLRGRAGEARARHLPQHHRQQGAGARPDRGQPARAACRSSWAPTRSPRRRDILHELAHATRASASPPSRPRTRSPRSARRSAPPSAARSASPRPRGPGIALKAEAMNLAVMVELPLVVIDIQRGGPSTGLPTKTEQADLLQAMFGRNGESPLPVVAASLAGRLLRRARSRRAASPSRYMMPVVLLSDGYIANGSEPWKLPRGRGPAGPARSSSAPIPEGFQPYQRDPRDAGAPLGDPRHAGPRAPHRRHREAGRHRQHHLRPGEPRAHGAAARREGGAHRRRHPAARGRTATRGRRAAGARLGLDRRARSPARCNRARQRGPEGLAAPTSAT